MSAVASALDLNFDKANAEFVAFYDKLVQPLTAAGVTVVLLDNIGHSVDARSRAKGVSAKSDRADLTLSCRLQSRPAALIVTVRKVRTVRASFERGDEWRFHRDDQRIEALVDGGSADSGRVRPTALMEKVSRAVEAEPGLTRNGIRRAVGGKSEYVDLAVHVLVAEGFLSSTADGQARRHSSVRPYRENDDPPTGTTGTQPRLNRDPAPAGNRDPVPRPLGRGPGDRSHRRLGRRRFAVAQRRQRGRFLVSRRLRTCPVCREPRSLKIRRGIGGTYVACRANACARGLIMRALKKADS